MQRLSFFWKLWIGFKLLLYRYSISGGLVRIETESGAGRLNTLGVIRFEKISYIKGEFAKVMNPYLAQPPTPQC